MVEPNLALEQFDGGAADVSDHGGCGSCGTGSAVDSLRRCGNGLEKIYPTTAVRYGYMRVVGEFSHPPDMKFSCGCKVVVQTRRGIEIGEQVSLTCGGCDKSVTRDAMKKWVDACGTDSYVFEAGRILRETTAADLAEYGHIQNEARPKRDFARAVAIRRDLAIKVVDCESLFGGERIIFYFTAAERVDFRDMVRDLAEEYRTRIEMRQIGARDEARLVADFETCGREICCKVFLKTLRPISMRMAKLQKATLDPSQVSGRCGRLKCCLRYEHTGYEELNKRLPRMGVRVRTEHGDGVIIGRQVLTQLAQIRMDDDRVMAVVVEDILETNVKAPPPPDPKAKTKASDTPRSPRRRTGGSGGQGGPPGAKQTGGKRGGSERSTEPKRAPRPSDQGQPASATPGKDTTSTDSPKPADSTGEAAPRKRRKRRRRRTRRDSDGSAGGGTGSNNGGGGSGDGGGADGST